MPSSTTTTALAKGEPEKFQPLTLADRIALEPPPDARFIRRGQGFVEFSNGQTITRWQWLSAGRIITTRDA
jgi:hypothetical protein